MPRLLNGWRPEAARADRRKLLSLYEPLEEVNAIFKVLASFAKAMSQRKDDHHEEGPSHVELASVRHHPLGTGQG